VRLADLLALTLAEAAPALAGEGDAAAYLPSRRTSTPALRS